MIKNFKMLGFCMLVVMIAFVLCACNQDTMPDPPAIETENATDSEIKIEFESESEANPEKPPLSDDSIEAYFGKASLAQNYVMPGAKDLIWETLEPTYDGIERLQLTYTVPKEYTEVLVFYQEATGRPEPDYHNAYGYFFDDVFVGEGEDYIEQILVQVLFGKSEVIMIFQKNATQKSASEAVESAPDESKPLSSDLTTNVLTIDANKTGLDLWASAKHKGFSSIEANYLIKAPFTEDGRKTVWLRENYVAEQVIVDDAMTKFYYYDPLLDLYHEGSELANSEGDDPILMGTILFVPAINLPFEISHNPLVIGADTTIEECYLTDLNGDPALYVVKKNHSSRDRMRVKQWLSLKEGIVLLEEIYSEENEWVQTTELESVTTEEVPFSTFFPRQDVVYQDKTLSFYFRDNPHGSDFSNGFANTFMSGYFDIELIDQTSGKGYTLTFNGDEMKTFAEYEVTENMAGTPIEIIRFREEDAFKVVVPSLETVYLYPSSVYEHMWFQLDTLGFRGRKQSDEEIVYTFEKIDAGGVSGMVQRYDYHIHPTTGKFTAITSYLFDPYSKNSPETAHSVTYAIKEPVPSDDGIFEVPDTFNTVWVFSHDDGEHVPPWWE